MDRHIENRSLILPTLVLTAGLACPVLLVWPSYADAGHLRTRPSELLSLANARANSEAARPQNSASPRLKIPPGTILPLQLATSISSNKSKTRKEVTAKIMQDIPLPEGQKIPKGSRVTGKVVAMSPASASAESEISVRLDKLLLKHTEIALITNLRAIAGYVEVEEAQIPVHASGESEVYAWLPTKQIGGDDVFGKEGTVTAWNNSSDVVGRSSYDGVLGRISSRAGTSCRGELHGNDTPQALWLFSSDACGVYGLPHVTIAHAGRDEPLGLIVLRSSQRVLHLPSGTGLLLRIDQLAD